MTPPTVSVLIATHNGGRFLLPALESVLAPRDIPLEVVLVDNAGTDGSVEAAEARLRDPRLRVVRSPVNTFHAGGLNLALREARGEFVALMDHDDLSCPGRLEIQLAHLRAQPHLDGVAGFEEEMDGDGRAAGPMFCVRNPAQFLAYSRYDMPFPMHNLMLRRAALEGVPWRPEFTWAMDFDFLQRLFEVRRIGLVPHTVYRYRVHGGAISAWRGHGLLHAATLCRLVAARRRAGRPEDLAGLAAELGEAREGTLPPAAQHLRYARRFAQEGFSDLALMLARRAWADRCRGAALAVAGRALIQPPPAGTSRAFLWRMALLGPAHTLRLESHPPLPPRTWNLFRSHRRDMHARVAG